MQENAEYCDGQDFSVVHVSEELGFRLWQCKRCAYGFSQRPISDTVPIFPSYHPKPIPMRFMATDEQKNSLRATLETA